MTDARTTTESPTAPTRTPRLCRDTLVFDTDPHGAELRVTFQRTLRIPDDGKTYPLPPGLGSFPLRRVTDFADRVPAHWRERGGVFLPMYAREAMWLSFSRPHHRPCALQVGVGKVNAVNGKPWSARLAGQPQGYVVAPEQPWLDGIATGQGAIRQFVAMPLGQGYTVEGQVTGEETEGGVQLAVWEPVPGRFPTEAPRPSGMLRGTGSFDACAYSLAAAPRCAAPSMGLAAGGRMKQKIYPDPHGLAAWQAAPAARVFVHLCPAEAWREITGEAPPPTPVTAKEYARHGLPWFDLYDDGKGTLAPTDTLAAVKSVKQLDAEKSGAPLQDDEPVEPGLVKKLGKALGLPIDDGEW